jgi:hypothetical protein
MAFRAIMSFRTLSCMGCVMLPKITFLLLFTFVLPHALHAAEFLCSSGDATCLIAALNSANDTPEADTITLGPGLYTLTTVDNDTDGANGLPSIRSTVTLRGTGADRTIVERDGAAPFFRLVHIGATGSLILDEISLRGGVAFSARLPGDVNTSGGAIVNRGTLSIMNSVLMGNSVQGLFGNGGAILTLGTLSIMNSVLMGNFVRGQGGSGGAINASGPTVTTVTNTTFASNFTRTNRGSSGGAISNGGGMLAVTNSTFTDNSTFGVTSSGGAIFNAGTVSITSSTLARNTVGAGAFSPGGGALWNGPLGTVMITNSTLADNTASSIFGSRGGGIENPGTGTVTLQNTILAGNSVSPPPEAPPSASGGRGPECFGAITSLDHNLIGDPTDCTISLLGNDLTGDPGLGEFTDDGTPGGGHFPLLASSQAIDRASPEAYPPTDQLGFARIGICDIGAVEFQTTVLERPTNKDQCMNDGWQTFTNPTFKNQGDCIQFVNTGK